MKKTILIFSVIILLMSCSSEKKADLSKHLDFNVETTATNPSEILETRYIKLETIDNSLIGKFSLIESTDSYIFILDIVMGKLSVFEHNGKYVGEVGRKGRGPEEFISPISFFIDEKEGYIAIIDDHSRKVNRYSLSNGFDFISSSQAMCSLWFMEITQDGNVICINNNIDENDEMSSKHFLVFDNDLEIINSLVDKHFKTGYITSLVKAIYKRSGEVFGYTQYESVIYKLSKDGAIPFYTLSFGENVIPPLSFYQDEVGEDNPSHFKLIKESGYVSYFSALETFGNLYTLFVDNGSVNIGLWDKKVDKTYCYNREYFANKMNIGTFSSAPGIVLDYFVAPLNISEIQTAQKDGAKINDALAELIKDSKEGDNPILFLFKTK